MIFETQKIQRRENVAQKKMIVNKDKTTLDE